MPARVAGTVRPPGTRRVARPIAPAHGVQRPGGSKRYGVNVSPILVGGPGQPPSGFLTGNNSPLEWPIMWACEKVLGSKAGEGDWDYQTRISPQLPGGIKPDFVIYDDPPLVLRVQSDRYHINVNSWKAAYDLEQRLALERLGYHVIDVFPQYYVIDNMGPKTGAAAIQTVIEARAHRQRVDPRGTATSWARA